MTLIRKKMSMAYQLVVLNHDVSDLQKPYQLYSFDNRIGAVGGAVADNLEVMSPATLFAELFRGYMNDESLLVIDDLEPATAATESGGSAGGSNQSSARGNNDSGGDSHDIESTLVPDPLLDGNIAPAASESVVVQQTTE